MTTTRYDFIAIGGGNAGLTAAGRVAAAGRRVALVDRGPVGGLCSLNGCNPKKVLVRTTELLDEIRHAARFGIVDVGPARADWTRVIDRKETFTAPVTPATERSLAAQGIAHLRGAPRFAGPQTLVLGDERLEADAILVATGSTPRRLAFPGADLVLTTDDLLARRSVPRDLVVVGAGVVAFELGQVFARLGSRVTILAPRRRALAGHDEELVEALAAFSAGLGIELLQEARVDAVRSRDDRLAVEVDVAGVGRRLPADVVLNAAGRVPALDDLDLDAAGVARTERGGVDVDRFLRSRTNPAVLAAGDAHGRLALSPVASYEGRVVARNFLEGDVERADWDAIPKVVFTVPPLASVGVTEAEARARGLEPAVVRSDMTGWKVHAIAGDPIARAKVLVDPASRRILGAHLYGSGAGDTINLFALAIGFGLTADDLKSMVFTYPTFASALPHTLG